MRSWRPARVRERVVREVLASGLAGAAGRDSRPRASGRLARRAPRRAAYVVGQRRRGRPGSYIDRLLMERDPQRVLEGMALAGVRVRARAQGYVYVRSEYPRARDALRAAVLEGARGRSPRRERPRPGFDFDVEVVEGAGSYVAGEETALIHSMEGLRGSRPRRGRRTRPSAALFGAPTVGQQRRDARRRALDRRRGGEAYARLGTGPADRDEARLPQRALRTPGRLRGRARHPAAHRSSTSSAAGCATGARCASLQVGGPLGGFLAPDAAGRAALVRGARGARGRARPRQPGRDRRRGSRAAALLRHVWRFAADESCGTCAPCRIGSPPRARAGASGSRQGRTEPGDRA